MQILHRTRGINRIILLSLVFIGCGDMFPGPPPVRQATKHERILNVQQIYTDLAKKEQDGYGAIYTDGCDSLLWSSLNAYAGATVQIDAFREENKWYRRPDHMCYPDQSHSTISRDQLTGLLFVILKNRRLDLAEGVIKYAENNMFMMGEGDISATHFTANMLGLYGRMIRHLGGKSKYAHYPIFLPPGSNRYHAHLQILAIILVHKIEGTITRNMLDRIEEHYERNPRNALFALMYSIYKNSPVDAVQDILLDSTLFPRDRLPVPTDRCGFYLWQYDTWQEAHSGNGTQWEPCKSRERFAGTDFLFAAKLYVEESSEVHTSFGIDRMWR